MILNFRVKNFKSIKDMIEIDFIANAKQKDHENSLIKIGKERVLPVISIYGANASGKSNAIQAFSAMARTITSDKTSEGMSYIAPFVYDEKSQKAPTFFEIEMIDADSEIIYRYGFECDKKNIFEEWLYKSSVDNRDDEVEVFYRNTTDDVFAVGDGLCEHLLEEIKSAYALAKSDELMLYVFFKRKISEEYKPEKRTYCPNVYSLKFLLFELKVATRFTEYSIDDIDEVMLASAEGDLSDGNTLSFASELAKLFDPSILELKYSTDIDENLNPINKLWTVRKGVNDKIYEMPAIIESSGTKKVLYMANHLSSVLKIGGIFLYDELDIKLHPLLFRKIIRMFTNKKTNPNSAQLICSSHNIICLDNSDLRRDSIYFAEKNENVTELYSLADIKINGEVVRKDLDFGKNYLLGRFGGIPFMDSEV